MADNPFNDIADSAKDAGKSVQETIESVNDLNSASNAAADGLRNMYTAAIAGSEDALKKIDSYKKQIEGIDLSKIANADFGTLLSAGFDVAATALASLQDTVSQASDGIVSAGAIWASGNISVSESYKEITRSANSMYASISDDESFNRMIAGLNEMGKVGEVAAKKMEQIAAHVDAQNNLENALITSAGAAGDFARITEIAGEDLQDLDKVTAAYNETIEKTRIATGLNGQQAAEYAKEIMKIPGAFQAISKAVPDQEMSALEAAIRVTRGTTQDQAGTMKLLQERYLLFNDTGDDSLKLLSDMYYASQDLSFNYDVLSSRVNSVAEQFAFMGDSASSALNILEGFSEGAESINLDISDKNLSAIVKSATDAVAQMDIAQKSLLSSQTGGSGSLVGGFQIEAKLREENGLSEVVGDMMDALKMQMGGSLVTLDEAATSTTAANQMQKQLAFLESGPFGKIVDSMGGAYDFLEMIDKGVRPEDQLKAAQRQDERTTRAVETGDSIQQRQENALNQMSAQFEKATGHLASIDSKVLGRGTLGGAGVIGNTITNNRQQASSLLTANISSPNDDIRESVVQLKDSLADVVGNFSNIASDISDAFSKSINVEVTVKGAGDLVDVTAKRVNQNDTKQRSVGVN